MNKIQYEALKEIAKRDFVEEPVLVKVGRKPPDFNPGI